MTINAIDSTRIEAMLAQIRSAVQKPSPGAAAETTATAQAPAAKVDFANTLKSALDSVNQSQQHAEQLGKNFAMGDDSVSLSDVMIASQKANITFQATLQVRNKLVSAYQDIMNMQV